MGEVAEQSEDGEGRPGCNTLSVTFGDSSPRGRAKGLYPFKKVSAILQSTLDKICKACYTLLAKLT